MFLQIHVVRSHVETNIIDLFPTQSYVLEDNSSPIPQVKVFGMSSRHVVLCNKGCLLVPKITMLHRNLFILLGPSGDKSILSRMQPSIFNPHHVDNLHLLSTLKTIYLKKGPSKNSLSWLYLLIRTCFLLGSVMGSVMD